MKREHCLINLNMASNLQITLNSLKNSMNNIRSVAQGVLSTVASKFKIQLIAFNLTKPFYGPNKLSSYFHMSTKVNGVSAIFSLCVK